MYGLAGSNGSISMRRQSLINGMICCMILPLLCTTVPLWVFQSTLLFLSPLIKLPHHCFINTFESWEWASSRMKSFVMLFKIDWQTPVGVLPLLNVILQAFSKDGTSRTIKAKDLSQDYKIGRVYKKELSFADIRVINALYQCSCKSCSKLQLICTRSWLCKAHDDFSKPNWVLTKVWCQMQNYPEIYGKILYIKALNSPTVLIHLISYSWLNNIVIFLL